MFESRVFSVFARLLLGKKGEAVVDFFLADRNSLRLVCLSPPMKRTYYYDKTSQSRVSGTTECDVDDCDVLDRHW